MINLQLEIHEVEALLKHIENSAKALLEKIHAQSMPQVIAAAAQNAVEQKPAE